MVRCYTSIWDGFILDALLLLPSIFEGIIDDLSTSEHSDHGEEELQVEQHEPGTEKIECVFLALEPSKKLICVREQRNF